MIKVLIVDDSAFVRNSLTSLISKDSDIEIAGTARDGEDALEKIEKLNPDVVTLDVDMPRMDGITTLKRMMQTSPRPVIMVSSLTREGAETTLKAMEYGALDFIPKAIGLGEQASFAADLVGKIRAVSRKKSLVRLRAGKMFPPSAAPQPITPSLTARRVAPAAVQALTTPGNFYRGSHEIVAIGVSTGGPPAVQKILSALPARFPVSIVIAQHMPAAFTGPFASRLDNVCNISVKEAEHGDRLKPGCAYVAPGGKHLTVLQRAGGFEVAIGTEPTSALYKPSATVLMESVARASGRKAVGLILTGMGSDGLEGIRALKERGGHIMAQNEASCVVYGMPKAIVDANLADQILDIDHIADALMMAVNG